MELILDQFPLLRRIYTLALRWVNAHMRLLQRIAVIFAVLVLSAYLGRTANVLVVLPFAGLIGLLILIRWPAIGLPGVIFASFLVPIYIGTGTGSSLNAPMLVLGGIGGLWILDMVARERAITLIPSRTIYALAALIAVTILAFLAGQLPWFNNLVQGASVAAQIGGTMIFVLSALAYIWVAHKVTEWRWIKWSTWLFMACGGIYVASRIIPGLDRIVGRLLSHGVMAGSLFWTWMLALCFSQLLLNRRLKLPARLAVGVLLAGTFYVAFVQSNGWKSGWFPGVLAMLAIFGLRWPQYAIWAAVVGIAPAINVIGSLISADAYSYSTRIDAWVIMAEIIKVNPLLGLGPSNYYFYTVLFPIRGYYVTFNSHNQYVDIIAQTGLLGMACFIWFVVEVGLLAWRLRTRYPPESGFPHAYLYGVLGGLVGTVVAGMLGDWILPFVYNIGFNGFRASVFAWLFLGTLLAIDRMSDDAEQAAIAKETG